MSLLLGPKTLKMSYKNSLAIYWLSPWTFEELGIYSKIYFFFYLQVKIYHREPLLYFFHKELKCIQMYLQ